MIGKPSNVLGASAADPTCAQMYARSSGLRIHVGATPVVVIAAGGHGQLGTEPGDSLVAFALPKKGEAGPTYWSRTIERPGGQMWVNFGLIFLGQMLGYLEWDVWLNILRLWPLLLVALGLEIAGKGLRSEWVRALGNVVVIAIEP